MILRCKGQSITYITQNDFFCHGVRAPKDGLLCGFSCQQHMYTNFTNSNINLQMRPLIEDIFVKQRQMPGRLAVGVMPCVVNEWQEQH